MTKNYILCKVRLNEKSYEISLGLTLNSVVRARRGKYVHAPTMRKSVHGFKRFSVFLTDVSFMVKNVVSIVPFVITALIRNYFSNSATSWSLIVNL